MQDFWKSVEVLVGENLLECVKIIMIRNGYDCDLSLSTINEKSFEDIENYTIQHLRNSIITLNCCHSDTYKTDILANKFQFSPGHKQLILYCVQKVKDKLYSSQSTSSEICERIRNEPALSKILKEIVKTAFENFGKTPNLNRYSETVKYFSTYVYMLCGRKCYEVLQSNFLLPAVSTVCMSD